MKRHLPISVNVLVQVETTVPVCTDNGPIVYCINRPVTVCISEQAIELLRCRRVKLSVTIQIEFQPVEPIAHSRITVSADAVRAKVKC